MRFKASRFTQAPDGPLTVDDDRRNREVGGDIPGEFNPAEKESSEAFGSLSERRNDEADRGGEQRPRNRPRDALHGLRIELPIVGSPPLMRSWAPAITAPEKKMLTTPAPRAPRTADPAAGMASSSPSAASVSEPRSAIRSPGMKNTATTMSVNTNPITGSAISSRSFCSTPHEVLASSMVFRMRPMAFNARSQRSLGRDGEGQR